MSVGFYVRHLVSLDGNNATAAFASMSTRASGLVLKRREAAPDGGS